MEFSEFVEIQNFHSEGLSENSVKVSKGFQEGNKKSLNSKKRGK